VEVDTETGQVRLRSITTCDDAGRLVNPMIVEGQRHGGIAQGVAQALMEEIRYDDDGNPVTSNFADYSVISAAELPSFSS
jgi:carbon-monoxide dehydrogenase large subunit